MLRTIAPDVWELAAPLRFLGFAIGTRMVVVRLPGGGLLLHSPVAIDEGTRGELEQLGPVTHIVCPNPYHHLFAGQAQKLYPEATLSGARGLADKRRDLRVDRALDETPADDWAGAIDLITIRGSLLRETVLLHKPSRTLVSADLVEYYEHHDEWITRTYLKLAGVYGKVTWNRFLRFLYRDRAAARASIDRVLAWDFDRATLAHGHIIERDARAQIERGFEWL